MKKVIIAASVLFLAACSSPTEQLLNVAPHASLNAQSAFVGKTLTIDSRDLRTAEYVGVIDSGSGDIEPIDAKQNVRIAFEETLSNQLEKQGFKVTVESDNTFRIDVLEAVVRSQVSMLDSELTTAVKVQVVAETPRGKFTKRFNGTSTKTSSLKLSNQDMEIVLNDLINAIFDKIATDDELNTYLADNF